MSETDSSAAERLPSTSQSVLHLPAAMHAQIIDHAQREAPRECCGVIVGPTNDLRELHELTNTYEGVDFYLIEPKEIYQVYRDAAERDWDIQVIYHSHPISVAHPSARDIEHAAWPDSVYVICSLEHPDKPYMRAFDIVDGEITERAIELI
jgi:[CysO sulfur-carrier protein]-S-L-cysteine hydrolase